MITSTPRSAASTACPTVVTCTITRAPASCACCTRSPGSPRANEITAGRAAKVWRKASASSSCGMWLTAYGRFVSFRTTSMSRLIASVVRNSEPMPPSPPWLDTAAANSADVAEPIGARMMGTSMPKSSHSGVLSIVASAAIDFRRVERDWRSQGRWPAYPSTWRQDLSPPRIVQRDQPATISLTTQDVGGFSTHCYSVARGIGAAKTPPANVERQIPGLDQLLRLGTQHRPECRKPRKRFPDLSGSSGKPAGLDDQDRVALVGGDSPFEICVVNRLHKFIDRVDWSSHSDSPIVKSLRAKRIAVLNSSAFSLAPCVLPVSPSSTPSPA